MKKSFFQGVIQKSGDEITIVATDETLDRYGEVLNIEDWDISKYKQNPVLLIDHNHRVENIVGLAKNIRIEKDTKRRMTFSPVFHEITPLSKQVKEMVETGNLLTVSVGFIPHSPDKDGERGMNELIEISFVTVPANPGAHVLTSSELLAVKSFYKKETGEDLPEEEKEEEEKKDEEVPEETDAEKEQKAFDVLQALGWFLITEKSELGTWEAKKFESAEAVLCSGAVLVEFLREKQKALSKKEKGRNLKSKEQIIYSSLKEVARIVNQGLYQSNKVESKDE